MTTNLVAVKCTLSPGIFPSERYFEVILSNGEKHQGIAPRHFCWNSRGIIVSETEVADKSDGWVAAKLLPYRDLPASVLAVEVPDGEVVAVFKNHVTLRPTPINPPEPFAEEEKELPGYVSHGS